MKALKKYVAECLGTFVLVFFACGAAVKLLYYCINALRQ